MLEVPPELHTGTPGDIVAPMMAFACRKEDLDNADAIAQILQTPVLQEFVLEGNLNEAGIMTPVQFSFLSSCNVSSRNRPESYQPW